MYKKSDKMVVLCLDTLGISNRYESKTSEMNEGKDRRSVYSSLSSRDEEEPQHLDIYH